MVANNPIFRGGWSIKKFNATVINDIWPEVMFFTLIATMVTLISELTPHKLAISNALLTVLGTVLGLVISFRTSSAYERYQDGRKMWTNISTASRNLAQLIWIHIPDERPDKPGQKGQTVLESVIEKKSMVNLVQAFSVAVKHYLRSESGVYYQDLYPLICILPRYVDPNGTSGRDEDMLPLWVASEDGEHPYEHSVTPGRRSESNNPESTLHGGAGGGHTAADHAKTPSTGSAGLFGSLGRSRGRAGIQRSKTFDPEKALADVQSHRPLKPARNPPRTTLYDYLPMLLIFKPITRLFRKTKNTISGESGTTRNVLGRRRKPQLGDSNVPLEITLFLSNYMNYVMRGGLVQPAVATNLMANLGVLQDTLQNLERIGNTPLPFAYQAHLRLSLWLYLLFLPFQIWQAFHYFTIPGTAFASFLLLGFLEIGQEIENPFNYDLNDLDLDSFCLSIQRECHEVTAHTNPSPSSFVFSAWNQPFAPADRRTAEEILKSGAEAYVPPSGDKGAGMGSLRSTLLNSWREVDHMTRHHKNF